MHQPALRGPGSVHSECAVDARWGPAEESRRGPAGPLRGPAGKAPPVSKPQGPGGSSLPRPSQQRPPPPIPPSRVSADPTPVPATKLCTLLRDRGHQRRPRPPHPGPPAECSAPGIALCLGTGDTGRLRRPDTRPAPAPRLAYRPPARHRPGREWGGGASREAHPGAPSPPGSPDPRTHTLEAREGRVPYGTGRRQSWSPLMPRVPSDRPHASGSIRGLTAREGVRQAAACG